MDNPRKLAFSSLVKADALSSYSNLEINTVISRSDMTRKNAALYTALYMGVTVMGASRRRSSPCSSPDTDRLISTHSFWR